MNKDSTELSSSDDARPKEVPESAIWVGGADGGGFIECKPHDKYPYIYLCEIYNDSTGEIEASSAFAVAEPEESEVDLSNTDLISGWDGDSILLSDGRRLDQVNLPYDLT